MADIKYVEYVQRFDRAVDRATVAMRCTKCGGPLVCDRSDRDIFYVAWRCEPCEWMVRPWSIAGFMSEYDDG